MMHGQQNVKFQAYSWIKRSSIQYDMFLFLFYFFSATLLTSRGGVVMASYFLPCVRPGRVSSTWVSIICINVEYDVYGKLVV